MTPNEVKDVLIIAAGLISQQQAGAPVEADDATQRVTRLDGMEAAAALESYVASLPLTDARLLKIAAKFPTVDDLIDWMPGDNTRVPLEGGRFLDYLAEG